VTHPIDSATQARLLGLFVAEADQALAELERLSERLADEHIDGEADELGRVAHGLKGAAAALELNSMASALHHLEAAGNALRPLKGSARRAQHQRIRRALSLLQAASGTLLGSPDAAREQVEQVLALLAPTPADGAAAAPADGAGTARTETALERLSVAAGEVDEALRIAASIARAAGTVEGVVGQELAASTERLEQLLLGLRMVPARETLQGLETEVGQLAKRLDKEVEVELEDHGVRADRRTLQGARTMIRHLVRNAIDHGFESPAARERAGKPRRGRLRVGVRMAEAQLAVEVADDGRGFDVAKIRTAVAATDGAAAVASLSDGEVLRRFALRGGSTRASATEISGRGIGLSAVVNLARSRGGDFQLQSDPGRGTSVRFQLPLEIFAVEVLTLRAGGTVFGLPLPSVERTLELTTEQGRRALKQGPSGALLAIDERIIQCVPLAWKVGLEAHSFGRFAVVVRSADQELAIAVDELGEISRVVPETVPPLIHADAMVTGVALQADRTRLQILNPRLLVAAEAQARRFEPLPEPEQPAQRRRALRVLLVEDSLTTREVLRVLLETQGCDVRVAGDGDEALRRIREGLPDLVLSDVNMPRKDGLALTRELKGDPATAALPVVLLTSQGEAAAQEAGLAAGAAAYLVKSRFSPALLRETLKRLGL
jgi:two-component system chemotaxis sensor kinase CheA